MVSIEAMQAASIVALPVIFLLSVAVLYHWLTKRIPSRLRADQAPRSPFGLVPVDGFGSRRGGGGVE